MPKNKITRKKRKPVNKDKALLERIAPRLFKETNWLVVNEYSTTGFETKARAVAFQKRRGGKLVKVKK